MHRHRREARTCRLASGQQIATPDAPRDGGMREFPHRALQVSPWIAKLQSARQDHVQRGSRNHAEMTFSSHRAGQLPTGHSSTHAPLNKDWMGYRRSGQRS